MSCVSKRSKLKDTFCNICNTKLVRKFPSYHKKYKSTGLCKKCMRGELHPVYNPNKPDNLRVKQRKLIGNLDWRKKTFELDNWECQCCGVHTKNLNAHHIFNYAKYENARLDEDNGVTLCSDCHKAFHKRYGKANNDINQFLHFLNEQQWNINSR